MLNFKPITIDSVNDLLPFAEAQPMESCFSAPPYPPIGCPLKWASTSMES